MFGANTQNTGFGAASKPTFSFGSTNTATTSTAGFSGFGTTTSSSGFGSFGTTATSSAAPFGTLGATPASTAPTLFGGGTSFGNTAAKPATGFGTTGFGTSTFGTGAPFGSTAPTFGSTAPTFGSTAPTFGSTAPTFGSTAPTFGSTAPTFGSTAPTFGSTAPTFGSTASGFGSTAPTFGTNTLGANTFGTSGFGTNTFGSTFGAKPATTGFGGFGTGLGTTNTFGQSQQQQQQQPSSQEALVAAVFNCCVFGDERDQVLAKWNLLQAQWGTGKAYYHANAPPLELNEHNPLCRFKAVGYSRLSDREDKDGHVALSFNKPDNEIKQIQQQLTTTLFNLLGSKPNLAVNIDSVKAVTENKSQVVIYVVDKNAGNIHISAAELSAFLNGASARGALTSAGVTAVVPVARPSSSALQQYRAHPPAGLDIRLWKQAEADNPDPDNYIPVPIVGFTEIKFRTRCQTEEASLQSSWLRKANETLAELRTRRASSSARLAQMAARLAQLRHTLLQVIARREATNRVGEQLTPEEEAIRARLHELSSQLAAPPLSHGRLNELLCAVRLQRSASSGAPQERYQLDPGAQEDLKQFLALQQKGMAHLMATAKSDLEALNIIAEGLAQLVKT